MTLSLTTGFVLGLMIKSSSASRNLFDIHWEINTSVEFRSMIAHSWIYCTNEIISDIHEKMNAPGLLTAAKQTPHTWWIMSVRSLSE